MVDARMEANAGADVSKERLEVCLRRGWEAREGEAFSVSNDSAGMETLLVRLVEERPSLVILEATGGFERSVAAALAAAGLPIAVVNPSAPFLKGGTHKRVDEPPSGERGREHAEAARCSRARRRRRRTQSPQARRKPSKRPCNTAVGGREGVGLRRPAGKGRKVFDVHLALEGLRGPHPGGDHLSLIAYDLKIHKKSAMVREWLEGHPRG